MSGKTQDSVRTKNDEEANHSVTDEALSDASSSDDSISSDVQIDRRAFLRTASGIVTSESMSFEDVFNEFTSDEDFSTPEVDVCYPSRFVTSSSSSQKNKEQTYTTSTTTGSRPIADGLQYSLSPCNKQITGSAEDSWGWFMSTSLK